MNPRQKERGENLGRLKARIDCTYSLSLASSENGSRLTSSRKLIILCHLDCIVTCYSLCFPFVISSLLEKLRDKSMLTVTAKRGELRSQREDGEFGETGVSPVSSSHLNPCGESGFLPNLENVDLFLREPVYLF